MPQYLNLSIGLVVFMGIAGGGMLALVLMASKRQQSNFAIMLGLVGLLGLLGAISLAGSVASVTVGLTNAAVLLVLSFALGYALTTYSALSRRQRHPQPKPPERRGNRDAVILLAAGEPPEYTPGSAARRLELADDPHDAPPILLRPFYMRELKAKYRSIGGRSPASDHYRALARKVQARLGGSYGVSCAYYADEPSLRQVVAEAIEAGSPRIFVVHVRVSDPPDQVARGDLLSGINPEEYGVSILYLEPLWDTALLPQMYVRRVLEVAPQFDAGLEETGLLLVGRGHRSANGSPATRQQQEEQFQAAVERALLGLGVPAGHIAIGWLRTRPSVADGLTSLAQAGCKVVYWIPSCFPADGINTLFDIPAQLSALAARGKIKLVSLGAWNADDLAAEEIANHVRATTRLSREAAGLAL